MQNQATGGVALTVYVMMTLLAIPGGRDTFKDNLDTATISSMVNGSLSAMSIFWQLQQLLYS
jgi:preprotein translocase subunit SecY